MLHITKNKKKEFQLVNVGENGELLASTEGVKTRQSIFKNLVAQRANFNQYPQSPSHSLVQDDIANKVWEVDLSGTATVHTTGIVKPKYISGKNPKKKK